MIQFFIGFISGLAIGLLLLIIVMECFRHAVHRAMREQEEEKKHG